MSKWIVLGIMALCAAAWGATYYVDQGHGQASDANPGTETAPFLTIGKAAQAAGPGDIVYVKAGTYNESVLTPAAGTPGNPISFISVPRRSAKVNRFMMTKAYTRVEGFEISMPAAGSGTGVNITADNVEAVDNYIYNVKVGIASGGRSNVYIGSNRIYHCQYGLLISGTDITVEKNEVERMYQYDTSDDSDYSRFFGDYITYKGNYFHGTIYSEIGNAHLDCWQTFDNNGEHASNIVWDGNWCSECHEGVMGEAIYHNNSRDWTYTNNIFAHSGAWGLCINTGISNIKVFNNVFYDIKYYGAGFGGATTTGVVLKNNIFSKCYEQPILVNNGAPPVTEDYNLSYQCGGSLSGAHDKLNVDPQFADAANNDFHLKAASPAINAGTTVEVTADYDGNLRPFNGGYDLGAFEYGAPSKIKQGLGQGSRPADWGAIMNPSPAGPVLARAGQEERYSVFDLSGKPLSVQALRRTGICVIIAIGNGMPGKIVVIGRS